MAFEKTGSLGQVARSLSYAKSPAQLVLAFGAYTTFFLLNRLFFPNYDILSQLGSKLYGALYAALNRFDLADSIAGTAAALSSFLMSDAVDTNRPALLVFYLLAWIPLSFFFGAITRISALQASRGQRIGSGQAIRYVLEKKHWRSYFLPPVYFVIAFLIVMAIALGISFICSIPYIGELISPVGFAVTFLLALLTMVIALFGVALFPLLSAAVSIDGSTSFDAISRATSYVVPHIRKYLGYLLVSFALGTLVIVCVSFLLTSLIDLSFSMMDTSNALIGSPDHQPKYERVYNGMIDRYNLDRLPRRVGSESLQGMESFAAVGIGLIVWVVLALIPSYAISYAVSASTGLYLMLRRQVDGTPFDTICGEPNPDDGELLDEAILAQQEDPTGGAAIHATLDRTTQSGNMKQ